MTSDDVTIEYCLFCGSLFLLEDETGEHVYCGECGSENFTSTCKDIEEYLQKKENNTLFLWKEKK